MLDCTKGEFMKSQKWATIITFLCSMFSLTALIVFFILGSSWSLGYDIPLAIFGSAILGFIISMIQYYSEKRKCMENFYIESLSILNDISKFKYLWLPYNKEKISNCLQYEYPKDMSTDKTSAKENLMRDIINNHQYVPNKDAKYAETIENIGSDMDECMNIYINFSKVELRQLHDSFGGLDFIFANKSIRNTAYETIYSNITDTYNFVSEKAWHFTQYFNATNGNKAMMLNNLLEMNNEFFTNNKGKIKCNWKDIIYRKKHYDISQELEKFRCKIYRKKYEHIENKPIEGYN